LLAGDSRFAISKAHLKKLIARHPQAEVELLAWHRIARGADWSNLADVRLNFPSADRIGMVVVFDILRNQLRHNQLRLITVATWRAKRIYIKALLTHNQYDRKE
jgi:mRNA interferase HigB